MLANSAWHFSLFVVTTNMPTWDDLKHKSNLKMHELDFVGCEAVFDGPVVAWDDDRETYGELRINLLGWLRGTVVQ